MIRNERQYKLTRAHLRRFESALDERRDAQRPADIDPGMWELEHEALASQIADLRAELADYERLRSCEVTTTPLSSLADIADLLIRARIARGLTQRELAERLGVREQQVQRDEAGRYASASLARLERVAEALGLEVEGVGRVRRR